MLSIIAIVMTITTLYIYLFRIFTYASSILIHPKNNKLLTHALCILNMLLVIAYFHLMLPLYLFYPFTFFVLAIEFKVISKANFLQAFCGSSVFALHMATVHIPILTLFSFLTKLPPKDMLILNTSTRFIAVITFSILLLALLFVDKILGADSIQRVTTSAKYSVLLLITTSTYVTFLSLVIAFIITGVQHDIQLLLANAFALFVLLSFYFVFIYSMQIVNMSFYKRRSDYALEEQRKMEALRKELSRKLERDDLTGVYSRKYILKLLQDLIADSSTMFSVLFIDINALKYTNDTYGHDAGDRLILKVTNAITESVRSQDFVARLGGDEFLVVLDGSSKQDTAHVISRIQSNISKQNETEDFLISASLGYISIDDEIRQNGVSFILEKADEIMRQNKEAFYKNQKEDTL